MSDERKIAVVAFLAVGALFGLVFALEWADVDYRKWFGFTLWTGLVFGYLLFEYGEDFRKGRCLLAFLAMLALHVVVLIRYLHAASFPNVFFLFFSPFEAGIGAFVLVVVGGARGKRRRKSHLDSDQS